MAHQKPNWSGIKSEADLKAKYFSEAFPGTYAAGANAVHGWDQRVACWGDPTGRDKKTPHAFEIAKVQVPGFGPQFNTQKPLRIHKRLAKLVQAVFERLAEVNQGRYVLKDVGGYVFRYMGNPKTYANIKDDKGGLGYDKCKAWWVPVDERTATTRKWAVAGGSGDWAEHAMDFDLSTPGRKVQTQWVSNHAFGTALDLNGGTNPNDQKRTGARFDMPPWVVQTFLDFGFYWGGFYCDFTHFEYLRAEVLEPPASGAKVWTFPLKDKKAPDLYALNEAGVSGFFPAGAFRQWHGGIHLPGDGQALCLADGKVVAARLPEEDPEGPDEGKTSRCFVLVKHALGGEVDGQAVTRPVYSLYYHLKAPKLDKSDAKTQELKWLLPLLEGYDPKFEEGKLYYRVATDEDEKDGQRGLGMRQDGAGTPVVAVVPKGEVVELLDDEPGNKWARVKHGSQEGTICTTKNRVELIDGNHFKVIAALKKGQVVPLGISVHAGDVLGEVGTIKGAPVLHVEVTSEEPCDHVPELARARPWKDEGNDLLVDVAEVDGLDGASGLWDAEKKIDDAESKAAAPGLHDVAAFHVSEWAAEEWKQLQGPPWNLSDAQQQAALATIQKHQWWKLAQAAGADVPKAAKLWHYHPAWFVAALKGAAGGGGDGAAAPPAARDYLEVACTDPEGRPLVDEAYEIELADGTKVEGKTDANGVVRIDDVPSGDYTLWLGLGGAGATPVAAPPPDSTGEDPPAAAPPPADDDPPPAAGTYLVTLVVKGDDGNPIADVEYEVVPA